MSTAVLSIGANVGDRLAALQSVIDAMRSWLRSVSPVYETPAWGPVEQDDFLNAVLLVDDPDADADEWLRRAHAIEDAAGRERTVRWGPRTLDVDVIAVDDVVREDVAFTLPHPRAAQRAFVLLPWAAVQPEAELGGRAIAELIAALPADEVAGVRRRPELAVR